MCPDSGSTHISEGGTSGMIMVTVDKNKCDGDGSCVNVCPQAVFKLEGGKADPVNMSECINCQTCVENCPQTCITVTEM
jgi:NAD-dependent dihydropyrimidine dehydrogenase PreA subunit